MCRTYITVAIIGTRWNKLVDEWAGRENGLTCILQGTLLSPKKHYKFTEATRVLSCVHTSTCHWWTFLERIFGKKIKRFLFDFNACVSSVLWCTMRFRCLLAIGVSRVFVRDAKSPTPAATTSTILQININNTSIWHAHGNDLAKQRFRDEKGSFIPFLFSNIVTRFRFEHF